IAGSHRGGCAGRRGDGRAVLCGAAARPDHAHSQRRRSARALPGRARPAVSVHQCKSATPFGRSDDHPVGRVFRMQQSAGTGRSAGMALGPGVACGGALRILRLPRRRRGGVVEADRSRTRVAGRRARSSDAMARGFDKGDRRERGNVAFFRTLRPPGDATRGALTPGGLQFGEAAAESKGLAAASKRGMERTAGAREFPKTRLMTKRPQVIVAGAGPVGLLTALALAKQDVSVLVLEAEPGLSFDLRAGTYHPPSLEMMAPYGITEEMHKTAIKVPRWQIRDRREGVIVEWDVTEIGDLTPYPYRLHLEQHRLTPIILAKLRAFPNAEVRFSHKVTDLSQAADQVTVTAATPGGTETFDAEWLVGADGGRSTVRKCTDVGFDGFTWDERFVVASTPYDYAPHGYALNAYLADPEEWAALFKMPDDGPPGIWRVIFPVPPEEEDAVTLSEEMVERRMQNFLPRKERYQVKYKSIYKVHQRVAKDFRLGRVLLAGDAAHLNNPMGAFGLNGGIHDSFNLTEKLGKVCRGEADETLLDLYVRQRRTVNLEYVQEHSIRNLKRLNEKSEEGRRKNFDELRAQAASREGRREFLLVSSMIASIQRANAIT